MLYLNKYHNYLLLFCIVIISHFIPLERISLAPDYYSLSSKNYNGFKNFIIYPDRPLLYFWLDLQYFFLKDIKLLYLILLIASNIFNIFCVYLFYTIFFSKNTSLLITIINILLFIKLEIYHNSIMIHVCIVTSLYILSLFFLIKYINTHKKLHVILSLILFIIAIFWYEIGFFLPFLIFFYKSKNYYFLKNKKKSILILTPFLFFMIFYVIFRTSNIFGFALSAETHSININFFNGLYDLINHYFGRYFFKNLIYGLLQFFKIKFNLFIIIIFINLIFIYIIYKKINYDILDKDNLLFFIILFILSNLPSILNGQAGGRNLIISSISFCYFIFIILSFFKKYFKNIYILFFTFGLMISQGNSWSQVISLRIQNSIFTSMENYKDEIGNAAYFIFNPKSLANKIDHSLVNNDYNLINTYYGAQVWEIWGIWGYLRKYNFRVNSNVIVVNKNPIITGDKIKLSKIIKHENYSIKSKTIELDNNNLFILDYSNIYKFGFNDGKQIVGDD